MTDEQRKQLKLVAMGAIMLGLGINLYLLWNEGQETLATGSLIRPAMDMMVRR